MILVRTPLSSLAAIAALVLLATASHASAQSRVPRETIADDDDTEDDDPAAFGVEDDDIEDHDVDVDDDIELGDVIGPDGAAGVDQFGVTMIHPSLPGGEEWFLSDDPDSDPQFDPRDDITRNRDGSWNMSSDRARMRVYTSTGYDTSEIETYDRDELAEQGYMQAPNDWKNVEMTGFVRVNEVYDSDQNIVWYARGGRHTDDLACEGSAYRANLYYDGEGRWAKESWHVSYDFRDAVEVTNSIEGRWVGLKAVMRNIELNGQTVVKMEAYMNDAADGVDWELIGEWTDDGNWAGDSGRCGASDPEIAMTWGGPIAVFRWDGATDVDFRWLSVREIQP